MPKYYVIYEVSAVREVEIKAKSEQEARAIFDDLDGTTILFGRLSHIEKITPHYIQEQGDLPHLY